MRSSPQDERTIKPLRESMERKRHDYSKLFMFPYYQ